MDFPSELMDKCERMVKKEFDWMSSEFSLSYQEYRLRRYLAYQLAEPYMNPAAKFIIEYLINKKLEMLGF
jgi:hypothetical protein